MWRSAKADRLATCAITRAHRRAHPALKKIFRIRFFPLDSRYTNGPRASVRRSSVAQPSAAATW